MEMFKKQKGQTLIETAFILFVLLLILLGISEFARAWYNKNSLKNAVRQGARIAVVTPAATTAVCPIDSGTQQILCPQSRTFTPCPGSGIVNAVCISPGVSSGNSQVSICYRDGTEGSSGTLDTGDTVNVCGETTFTFVVGNSPWPWPKTITISTDASMRYE
jgi:Flp pilus assembly protein TadG